MRSISSKDVVTVFNELTVPLFAGVCFSLIGFIIKEVDGIRSDSMAWVLYGAFPPVQGTQRALQ